MIDDVNQYIGLIIAIIASAITYYFARKDKNAENLRLTTGDALKAQAIQIEILEGQVKHLKEENERLKRRLSFERDDNYNLRQELWHLKNDR